MTEIKRDYAASNEVAEVLVAFHTEHLRANVCVVQIQTHQLALLLDDQLDLAEE